jgi:hypothetical protein
MPVSRFNNFTASSRKANMRAFGFATADQDLSWIADSHATPGAELTLVGTQDGVNTVFTLAEDQGLPIVVIMNGLTLSTPYDYTQSGLTVTFVNAPDSDDMIKVLSGGIMSGGYFANASRYSPVGVKDSSNVTYTIPVQDYGLIMVLYNGQVLSPGTGYTISGNTITMTTPPAVSDILEAILVP